MSEADPQKKDRYLKPASLLAPVPVTMATCQGAPDERPNIITLAWAGVACSDPPALSIAVAPSRYSHDLIRRSEEFVINLVSRPLVEHSDWCGVVSGRDRDKFEACGLTPLPIDSMKWTPAIQESPLSLACRLESVTPLGSHDLFIGRVTAVRVQEQLMDETGRMCLEKADLIAFLHGEYFDLGKRRGFFGFSVASDKALKRRMPGFRRKYRHD